MGIAFVDIDGVLFPHGAKEWSRVAINNLNRLCEDYDLKIVITSEWRKRHSLSQLQEIFKEKGITAEVVGCTGLIMEDGMSTMAHKRGFQIQEYLNENWCHRYVIFDDIPVGYQNTIICRSWVGLTITEYEEARKLLISSTANFDTDYEIRSRILKHLYHHPMCGFGDINYATKLELFSTSEVSAGLHLLLETGKVEKCVIGYDEEPIFPRVVFKISDKSILDVETSIEYGV